MTRKHTLLQLGLTVGSLGLALFGCGQRRANQGGTAAAQPGRVPKICVAQYVSHPLLDAVYNGFKSELAKVGLGAARIDFKNASGDQATARVLADQFCSADCDLIFALATPMAQSIKTVCPSKEPILFGAITDPVSAGLVETMSRPGGNLTGTSDQWPYELQMRLLEEVWGEDARVGIPFNPGEANTDFAMTQTRKAAEELDLRLIEVPVSSISEVSQAVSSLAGRVDVVYVPADNTVIAAAPAVVSAANRAELPVFAGDPGTFSAGATLGLGVSYENLGKLNAKQAAEILAGASPSEIPVDVSNQPTLMVNAKKYRSFGLDTSVLEKWRRGEK